MRVHEVELDHGTVQFHWLFVVKLGCKRMMRCQGQHTTHHATHKKNEHADSHYHLHISQNCPVTSHASMQACALNTSELSIAESGWYHWPPCTQRWKK
jgi:hypothetical protein